MLSGNSNLLDEFYNLTNKLIVLKRDPVVTKDHIDSFDALLASPKWNGQSSLKIMAAQFIPRYIHFFPESHEAAINAQLDFCEDQDVKVRKESIKNLAIFAKSIPEYAGRVADVLLQLLQAGDADELKVVKTTLLHCFQLFPKGKNFLIEDSLDALFHQIQHGIPLVRERACDFIKSYLLPVSAAGMKQKILSRFLPLFGKTLFTEIELGMIFLLLPDSKLSGTPIYNAQLEILYKKKLEAMVANPKIITAANILELSKFYKHLFITGTSSFSFITFLIIHVLSPKQSLLQSVVEELQILKLVCDLLSYTPELGSLVDLVPYFQNIFQALIPSLSTTDTIIKLPNMKLEPILYFFVYYRVKSPSPVKSNNPILEACLRKSYVVAQHMKDITMKELISIPENSPKREPRERILATTSIILLNTMELLKGPAMSQKLELINSWNVKASDYLRLKFPALFKTAVGSSSKDSVKMDITKAKNSRELMSKNGLKLKNEKNKLKKSAEMAKPEKFNDKSKLAALHSISSKPPKQAEPVKLEPVLLRSHRLIVDRKPIGESNSKVNVKGTGKDSFPTVRFVPSKSKRKDLSNSSSPGSSKKTFTLSQKLGVDLKKSKKAVSDIILVKKNPQKVAKKSKTPVTISRTMIVRQ